MSRLSANADRGVLLVAHGTRSSAGVAETQRLARQVARLLPQWPVELAFLELAQPDVPLAAERLLQRRLPAVVVAPLLLFAAGHWKRDLPELVAGLRSRYPEVRFLLLPPLECDEAVVALAAERFREAQDRLEQELPTEPLVGPLVPLEEPLGNRGPGAAAASLILVGRGTSDQQAQQQFHRLGALVAQRTGAAELRTCFVERGRPLLTEVLQQLELFSSPRVVVQPHLLFPGAVLEEVHRQVEAARGWFPRYRLEIARPLGADAQLAELLARRVALAQVTQNS